MPTDTTHELEAGDVQAIAKLSETLAKVRTELGRAVVGQTEVIDALLMCLISRGHALLMGVPGLAKTLLVSKLSECLSLDFSRIQFTPDLMPMDITGTDILQEAAGGERRFEFIKGPIFANIVLADEINRAPAKTQAAMLEAMQEHRVTVLGKTMVLQQPFFVLATQNPVEQEGTYPLPEAQLDRFLLKLVIGYPRESDYDAILERTTGTQEIVIKPVSNGVEINELRKIVRDVPVPAQAKKHAIRLVMGTQPGSDYAPDEVNEYVALGASPRGAQALLLVGKVRALLGGRFAVSTDDIDYAAANVLRHRVMLNFHAMSDNVNADKIVAAVVNKLKNSAN